MKVNLYKETGEKAAETVDLNPQIFAVPKIRPELVHEVATSVLSNMRPVIASTKTRGEVRGGGKKPWQQKGTGRARAGSSRSPLWRGGGVTFGPTAERNFFKKINKKAKQQAVFSVLSERAANQKVIVLESLSLSSAKTRDLSEKLKKFEPLKASKKVLIVIPARDEKLALATRNLKTVNYSLANNLNILQLLTADSILILKEALPLLEKTYLKTT